MSLPSPSADRLRTLSKAVFGQENRLAVMLFVARHQDGVFCLSDLSDALGFRSASSAQDPLQAMVTAGLVVREELEPIGRYRWYRRVDSSAWAWAEELNKRALYGAEAVAVGN